MRYLFQIFLNTSGSASIFDSLIIWVWYILSEKHSRSTRWCSPELGALTKGKRFVTPVAWTSWVDVLVEMIDWVEFGIVAGSGIVETASWIPVDVESWWQELSAGNPALTQPCPDNPVSSFRINIGYWNRACTQRHSILSMYGRNIMRSSSAASGHHLPVI